MFFQGLPVFLPVGDGAMVWFNYMGKGFVVCQVDVNDSNPVVEGQDLTPRLPKERAIAIAKKHAFKSLLPLKKWTLPSVLNRFFKPGLVTLGFYPDKNQRYVLAYQLELHTKEFHGIAHYYLNAHNGDIINSEVSFPEQLLSRCGNSPRVKDTSQDGKIIKNPYFPI